MRYRRGIIIVVAMLAAGCSGLRERSEQAFRRHNAATAELMLVLPRVIDTAWMDHLEGLERSMNEACEPLDRLAARQRDGGDAGLSDRREVVAGLGQCECRTRLLEAALAAHDRGGDPPRRPEVDCG